MLAAYVSDEMHLAIPSAQLEIRNASSIITVQSSASGAVHADLPEGDYDVVISCQGYGSKRVRARLTRGQPYLFRLQSERPLGYVWPKAVFAGERGELRISSGEAYQLELYRYGCSKELIRLIGRFDDHPP